MSISWFKGRNADFKYWKWLDIFVNDHNENSDDITALQTKTANVVEGDNDWHVVGATDEPAFLNGWSNISVLNDALSFKLFPDNTVGIRGFITGGTVSVGTDLFVLPVGYRPLTKTRFPISPGSSASAVQILPDGTVEIAAAAAPVSISLGMIRFGLD